MNHLGFNFYGVLVGVNLESSVLADLLRKDFSYFISEDQDAQINIKISNSDLKHPERIFKNDINVQKLDKKILLCVGTSEVLAYDFVKEKGIIKDINTELSHFLAYEIIYARVRECLAQKGIFSKHAMALEKGGKSAVLFLPSGGGKSTLALALAGNYASEFSLVSDDMPMITRYGQILPFPVRLGFLQESDKKYYDIWNNKEKDLMSAEDFPGNITKGKSTPKIIILGERTNNEEPSIVRTSKLALLKHLIGNRKHGDANKDILFGSYFTTSKGKAIQDVGKIIAALLLALKSKVCRYEMSTKPEKNIEILNRYLVKEL